MIDWKILDTEQGVDDIKSASHNQPQLIFKHSTTCSISGMAKSRLERAVEVPEKVSFHYLDLKAYRSVSNYIAELFQVHHESPQVLLIVNGECVYDESHYGITMEEIVAQAV